MKDARSIILESIKRLGTADAPDALRPRIAGEIDMAYKLGLIDYPTRDQLMATMLTAASDRRGALHRAKLARLGIAE